jgi:DNA (cytosine-5)-methyltransferase 1
VFLVGHLGAAAAAGAVLFEPEGVRRNPPARREAREEPAATLTTGPGGGRYDKHPLAVAFIPEIAKCLTTSAQRNDTETETFVTASFDETQVTSPGNRSSCDPATAALTKTGRPPSIAFHLTQDPIHGNEHTPVLSRTSMGMGMGMGVCVTGDVTHALRSVGSDASEDGTGRGTPIVTTQARVRRLTPRECERLQGFPDDETAIPGAKDSPRYAALGNSMAVPVMRWIGERIAMVDALLDVSS